MIRMGKEKKKIPSFKKWVKKKYPKEVFDFNIVDKLRKQYEKEFDLKNRD